MRKIWSLNHYNGSWTNNHLFRKRALNHLAKWIKWLSCVASTYLYFEFDCMFLSSYHVTYAISERIHTLHSCLNFKGIMVWSMRKMCSLSHCSGTRTPKILVRNRIFNHWILSLQFLCVKKLLVQMRNKIQSSSESNGTQTQKHIVRKRTVNYLAKLGKWLSCIVNTYLYCAFECIFLISFKNFTVDPHSIVECTLYNIKGLLV